MRTRAEQWKRKGRMISALLAAALSLNGSCDSRFEGNKPLETAGQALSGTYLPDEGDVAVSVYQTTGRRGFREIFTTPFTPHLYTNRAPIDVDAAEVRGTYRWLGVSMTDASCWILSRLAPEKRQALLEAVFSPTKGAGLGAVRLNVGSSDYATALYTYDDTPGDVEMRHFSVARDDHWVFPMVKAALAVNPAISLFAAAWSPPGWMKTTGSFVDGHFKDGMELALANYLTAYAKALRERGLSLDAVSINNESGLSTRGTYPSCVFTPTQEAAVAKVLAKRLTEEGLSTRVWILDWNYHHAGKVAGELSDPDLLKIVGGVAWHSYGAAPDDAFYALKRKYPQVPFYHTEQGPARHDPSRNEQFWCERLRNAFENGCEGFTGWNLCLDEDGQPLTGPHLCAGLVEVDLETGDFTPSAQYNLFRHVGPFVKPGAEVLRASGDRDGMSVLLFRNPDGEHVLVCACAAGHGLEGRPGPDGHEPRPKLYVKFAGENKHLPLPFDTWSVTTMVFGKKGERVRR